jgi:hypothetical protein
VKCALRYFGAPVALTTGLFLWSGPSSLAEDPEPAQDVAPSHALVAMELPSEIGQTPPYTPITLKQKYEYSLEQMFSGPRLLAILAHVGYDQAEVSPHAWGSNAPAFGIRAASLFGRGFLRATIASGIRGVDHEDPRYFYSHKKDNLSRVKYAIVHTFEVYNDNGTMMPAYSRLITNFGMPFLAQTWHPGGVNAPDALRSGGIGIGIGMGMSIAQEFWPDVKHALHLGPGVGGMVTPGTIH